MTASWERGRPARTKPGTALTISPTWINRNGVTALLRPGRCCSRRQSGCLQHRTEAQRRPKGQDAGGTPALPGKAAPAVPCGSFQEKRPMVHEDEPRMDTKFVEIFPPFPTFGGSLLSLLQPLSGPSSSFVALRGFLFLAFVDNPQLFQTRLSPRQRPPPGVSPQTIATWFILAYLSAREHPGPESRPSRSKRNPE